MFGIMFGDILHGSMLTIFSLLICFSDRKPGTFMGEFGKVRYLLLMMGIFSLFAGIIYNDMTSIPLKLFGESCYHTNAHGHPELREDCIYPVGIDPVWYMSKNELTYINSLKMKLSVILGVG